MSQQLQSKSKIGLVEEEVLVMVLLLKINQQDPVLNLGHLTTVRVTRALEPPTQVAAHVKRWGILKRSASQVMKAASQPRGLLGLVPEPSKMVR